MRKIHIAISVCFILAVSAVYSGNYNIILDRNIFAPIPEPPKPAEPQESVSIRPVEVLPPLDGLLALAGTVVVKDAPGQSIAVLELLREKDIGFFRIGDEPAGARIIGIEDNQLTFEYAYGIYILAAHGSYHAPVFADKEYRLGLAELLQRAEEEMGALSHTGFYPVEEDGATVGIAIYNIPEMSLLAEYGFRDHDIITRINTVDLDAPGRAFHIYEKIMKHGIRRVTIDFYRDNLPYTHLYLLH